MLDSPIVPMQYPEKLQPIVYEKARYKIAKGGRGSAKSWTFARRLLTRACTERLKILCAREIQDSIKDSVHALLKEQIVALGLSRYFYITQDAIYCPSTGSVFIFKGLRSNSKEIKSIEGVDICWVEEAEIVSMDSWIVLLPTIRKPGSEIWISYNPESENAAVHQMFVKTPRPSTILVHVNFYDNPWFQDPLLSEMTYDRENDPELYEHVWLGKFKKYAEDLVFRGKVSLENFETPEHSQFYFGMDFGFSTDPNCLNRMFIKDFCLYIDREAYGTGVELTELHEFCATVPGSRKWRIIADSARPDTISHLKKPYLDMKGILHQGFPIVGAVKGEGSVEEGITFIRGFKKVIIHKDNCPRSAKDWNNYRYKRDRITNDVLPIPIDKNNHSCDATRYALEKLSKQKGSMWQILQQLQAEQSGR